MELNLTIHRSYVVSMDAFICFGEGYSLPNGLSATVSGDYPVMLQSEHGCDSLIQTRLVVHPTYEQELTDTVCEREPYVLPDGRSVVGPGVYESMFTTREGCDSLIRMVLIENSEPSWLQLTVTPNPAQMVLGNSLIMSVNSTHGGVMEYVWEPSDDLSCDRCPNPTFTGTRSRTYTIRGVTESGCRSSRNIRIQVDGEYNVLFPNVFSPNDNGLNDVFKPGGLGVELTLDYYLAIYDRWGEKLFETDKPQQGWDGTYRGESVQEGVYMYYARVTLENGERKMFRGTVTLLR